MNRRSFLKGLGFGLALGGLRLGPIACARGNSGASAAAVARARAVAVVTDPAVRLAGGLSAPQIDKLLARAIRHALGAPEAETGLRGLVSPDDTVGIKLNCLAGPPLSPKPELVAALVGLLTRSGVPAQRILVFERGERDLVKGGFAVTTGGAGPLFLGNDSPGAGYEEEVEISGQVGSCLSRLLTRRISVLINLGVLKDHNLAGLGGGMKNLFGLIHNPNKYHDNGCDPFVADVLGFPVIQRKLKLTILDALTAQCHAGPGYQPEHAWDFNGVLVSTDPVAIDRVAWDLIETRRKRQGLPPLAKENRAPRWIATAARRNFGVDDLNRIRIVGEG